MVPSPGAGLLISAGEACPEDTAGLAQQRPTPGCALRGEWIHRNPLDAVIHCTLSGRRTNASAWLYAWVVRAQRAACPHTFLPSLPRCLQDYAWLESQLPRKLAARPVRGEPMFCFETALKAFYYAFLVYEVQSEGKVCFCVYGGCYWAIGVAARPSTTPSWCTRYRTRTRQAACLPSCWRAAA